MLPTVELFGRAAAPGLAVGPVVALDRPPAARRATGSPVRERESLEQAIAAAIAAIGDLARAVGGDAADILDFQIAMLEDSVLIEPALERIAAGADAAAAWGEAIAGQIADYGASDNDYFRARAADLKDLRDRVLRLLAGTADATFPDGAVLTGEDVTPTRFLSVDWSKGGGIALSAGSPSSHVAMLARSRGVPMVVGLGAIDATGHDRAIVDGDSGRVVLSPGARDQAAFEHGRVQGADRRARETEAAARLAVTADGVHVAVRINVADPAELTAIDPATCDGVGLVRTEFLFHQAGGVPDEDAQYRAYRSIVEWAAGRPVVLRTLDAGGDKPVDGLTIPGESNPFLGTRGIRLSLRRPDIFRVQLRALARAAVHGDVKVMLPMVTVPEEIDRASALLDEAITELNVARIPCRRPPLGIMVEVPAAAIEPELFARAAFFSIGSNDLTQYVTASARDIAAVSALADPGHPAVLSLIRRVVSAGKSLAREVSLCGDMGSDPVHIPALIRAGLRIVSVAPPLVGRAKLAILATRAAGP
jgi:phosphotransferase system enzyme I (PtsI)